MGCPRTRRVEQAGLYPQDPPASPLWVGAGIKVMGHNARPFLLLFVCGG